MQLFLSPACASLAAIDMPATTTTTMATTAAEVQIIAAKKQTARNLYVGGMSEEFIAMQLDLDIPAVIEILKEMRVYGPGATEEAN
ncbi:hypothetical protein [Nitrososphaera sp.]|uniref:hypothetical protein n=1 Tax=Nitrososphaera sp. TaxID=1971748 RepID=UPI00307DC7A2